MQSREELEKRVVALEQKLAALQGGGGVARGIRKRADWGLGDLPFFREHAFAGLCPAQALERR
jgi:hypothetical protein